MDQPSVLVVHAVDTEGPLGGDARRFPDGSAEFFDNWLDILSSLRELTSPEFRSAHADSGGRPYRFDWFVMDFTGFRSNPKERVAEYHDTWDHIMSLPVELDGRNWHYHVPPESGAGDRWSSTWLSSNECNTILARRLLERASFPAAFRAGGTIEDEAASRWLEEVVPIDFSNRVSDRSRPDSDLYSFDWFGAPTTWGSYHPAYDDVRRPGAMRRWIYRSIDLRSRYNELTEEIATEAFEQVRATGRHAVLSFFSHDNRDMRPETRDGHAILQAVATRTGVPWLSCTAVEAHCLYHGLEPQPIDVMLEVGDGDLVVRTTSAFPFQRAPFVAAELGDGRFVRLLATPAGPLNWRVPLEGSGSVRVGIACTSPSGDVSISITETP